MGGGGTVRPAEAGGPDPRRPKVQPAEGDPTDGAEDPAGRAGRPGRWRAGCGRQKRDVRPVKAAGPNRCRRDVRPVKAEGPTGGGGKFHGWRWDGPTSGSRDPDPRRPKVRPAEGDPTGGVEDPAARPGRRGPEPPGDGPVAVPHAPADPAPDSSGGRRTNGSAGSIGAGRVHRVYRVHRGDGARRRQADNSRTRRADRTGGRPAEGPSGRQAPSPGHGKGRPLAVERPAVCLR